MTQLLINRLQAGFFIGFWMKIDAWKVKEKDRIQEEGEFGPKTVEIEGKNGEINTHLRHSNIDQFLTNYIMAAKALITPFFISLSLLFKLLYRVLLFLNYCYYYLCLNVF